MRPRRSKGKQKPTDSGRARGQDLWLYAALIAGFVAWSYSTSFAGVFLLDDRPAIVDNVSIRSWATVFDPPLGATVSGRPVANLTFAVNYALGHELRGYHAVNVAIHLAAGLLVFGIMRRTLGPQRPEGEPTAARRTLFSERHATHLAGVVALLWAVHPLHTGAVTYIVQRVESLMGLSLLLALYCAIRGDASGRRLWWVAAVAACALGMATKEITVVAPLLVWLWFVVYAGAPFNPLADHSRRGLYLGLAACWIVLAILLLEQTQARTVLSVAVAAASTGEGWTPRSYLLTQAGVVVHYIRLVILPTPLVFDYYGWPQARSIAQVLPLAAILATGVILTCLAVARRHPFGFAGAWFFLILAPTSSILPIPTEIAAEHRMYLPSIAIIASVVCGLYFLLHRRPQRGNERPVGAIALIACALTAAGVLAESTRARNRLYHSEEAIWRDTVTKRPDNARARINYGITLMASGRYAEAEEQMRAAAGLDADPETRAQVHVQLGAALCAQGRCAEGIPEVERALQLYPDIDDADAVLGQAYSDAGDRGRALHYLRRAVQRDPDNVPLLTRAAWLLATTADARLADAPEAIRLGERAVALTGRRHAPALESLAAGYARAGRFGEAAATAAEALRVAEAAGDAASAAVLREQVEAYRRATR